MQRKLPIALLGALAVMLLLAGTAHADLGQRLTETLAAGSLAAYAIAFVLGVGTSMTPCVWPLIPITMAIFGAKKGVSRGRAVLLAGCYVAGICTMYTGLGVGVALTGAKFGAFMTNPWVIVPIAVLFLVLAASMFGAFELNLPQSLQNRLSSVGGAGFGGAYLMGLPAGIIAAPCTGPPLIAMLTFVATRGSVVFGASVLFSYALGMGAIFFVLAATAASLPKSGTWMEGVKSVFGVVMLLAALYFLRNVIPPLAHYGDWHSRWAAVRGAVAVAGVAVGGIHLSFHDEWSKRVRKGLGIGLIVFGGYSVVAWFMTAPPVKFEWVRGEAPATAKAKAEHKPMVLDFGAEWCNPCKEIELQVFGDAEVQRELAERFVVGKVDCTEEDEAISAVRAKYHADTLPTVLLLDADGKEARRWKEPMKAAEFLEAARATH